MRSSFSRRFLALGAAALASVLLAACVVAPPAAEAPAPAETMADDVTIFGATLPADALPYSQQVYRVPCNNTATQVTFDFAVSVYQRYCS